MRAFANLRQIVDDEAMLASLDGQPLTVTGDSFASALDTARAAAQSTGRIIVDVIIDGQRVDQEALESPGSAPLGRATIAFLTAHPATLVSQSFEDVAAALRNAANVQQQAAQALQVGKMDEAFELLAAVVEVWNAAHQVSEQGPALLARPIASFRTPGGEALDKQVVALARSLQQLKSSVANQDWPALADLLEVEFDAHASTWAVMLGDLARQLTSSAPPAQPQGTAR